MMCTVVITWVHICIWVSWCFSAVTDVSVDYLTSFYNKIEELILFPKTIHQDPSITATATTVDDQVILSCIVLHQKEA